MAAVDACVSVRVTYFSLFYNVLFSSDQILSTGMMIGE
jgi:hypothetical protein